MRFIALVLVSKMSVQTVTFAQVFRVDNLFVLAVSGVKWTSDQALGSHALTEDSAMLVFFV